MTPDSGAQRCVVRNRLAREVEGLSERDGSDAGDVRRTPAGRPVGGERFNRPSTRGRRRRRPRSSAAHRRFTVRARCCVVPPGCGMCGRGSGPPSARAERPWNTWVRTRSAPRIRIVTRLRPAHPVCGWTRRRFGSWPGIVMRHGWLWLRMVVSWCWKLSFSGNRVSDSGRCRIDALDDVVFGFGLVSSFRRRAAGRACSGGRTAGCSSSSQRAGWRPAAATQDARPGAATLPTAGVRGSASSSSSSTRVT